MAEAALKESLPHIEGCLNADELRVLLGLQKGADLRKKLEQQGIVCFDGKNGLWTTLDLVKLAGMRKLGIIEPSNDRSML